MVLCAIKTLKIYKCSPVLHMYICIYMSIYDISKVLGQQVVQTPHASTSCGNGEAASCPWLSSDYHSYGNRRARDEIFALVAVSRLDSHLEDATCMCKGCVNKSVQ